MASIVKEESYETDTEEEVKMVDNVFVAEPLEGTPAHAALKANAGIRVTRFDKTVGRRIKRPKTKNLTRNMKRKKGRKRRSYIKGKIIDGQHEQYTLALGMMHALRTVIGRRTAPQERVHLVASDFTSVDKYVFPPNGVLRGPLPTPPHNLSHTFKFKDYSPLVFRAIREMNDIEDSSYMLSVCGNRNFIEFIPNSKSGQFFFYSHDGKYMIKTQTPEENKFLRRILPHYYAHLRDNPDSLMTRFYGMHRVKMYHIRRKVHFVIMGSVFNTTERIHTIYDLKGSRVGRQATAEERSGGGVLKDNDLVNDQAKIVLGPKKARFLDVLRRDVAFLQEMQIMDYSLLLGIHDKTRRAQEEMDGNTSPKKRSDTPLTRAWETHHRRETWPTGAEGDDRITFELEGGPSEAFERQIIEEESETSEQTIEHAPQTPTTPSTRPSSLSPERREGFLRFFQRRKVKLPRKYKGNGNRQTGAESAELRMRTSDPGALTEMAIPDGEPVERVQTASSEATAVEVAKREGHPQMTSDEDFSESEIEDVDTDEETREITVAQLMRGSSQNTAEINSISPGSEQAQARKLSAEAMEALSRRVNSPAEQNGKSVAIDAAVATATTEIGNGTNSPRHEVKEAAGKGAPLNSPTLTDDPTLYGPGDGIAGATTTETAVMMPPVLTRRKDNGVRSRTVVGDLGTEIYFMGIIDILQQYTLKKRGETILRPIQVGFDNAKLISAVDPKWYGERFLEFIAENTI